MKDIRTKVMLNACALRVHYITRRLGYTNMYIGKTGVIIGESSTGKAAVEFDDIVFVGDIRSSHDNGCHGRGRDHYCSYIPWYAIDTIPQQNPLLLLC